MMSILPCLKRVPTKVAVSAACYSKVSVMDNGMRVVTEESSFADGLTAVALGVEAGARHETVCNNGITHFIGRAVLKGIAGMSAKDFEQDLYEKGIKLSVKTFRDYQIFTTLCFSEHLKCVIDILSKFVLQADLSDRELTKTRKEVHLEALELDENPKAVVFDYLHQTAFQGTPLGLGILGPTSNLCTFDKSCLQYYMRYVYQPHRMLLVATGNVNHDEVLSAAKKSFGKITKSPCPTIDYTPHRYTGSETLYRDDSRAFVHVAIAVEAPGRSSPDFLTLYVAKCIIGSWKRSRGGGEYNALPLARAAAVEGLCDSYESFYIAYRDVGLWGVYFVAEPMAQEDMLYNVQSAWMALCTMVGRGDVEMGANLAAKEWAKRGCGAARSCLRLAQREIRGGVEPPLPNMLECVRCVTPARVRKACDSILYSRCPAVAAYGPTEALPDYNRIRGSMYWLRR